MTDFKIGDEIEVLDNGSQYTTLGYLKDNYPNFAYNKEFVGNGIFVKFDKWGTINLLLIKDKDNNIYGYAYNNSYSKKFKLIKRNEIVEDFQIY